MASKNLHKAKKEKNDEFYTQLSDIENELKYYKKHFKDKIIYCNCDSLKSNFWKYFKLNFEFLELKKLIATHFSKNGKSYKLKTADGLDTIKATLKENGDFRSSECVELLEEADIVITNPPFSLFREYIAQLIKYDKKFLVIGNKNAVGCKEIFKLIKSRTLWLGYTFPKKFIQSSKTEPKNMNGLCRWFTNLKIKKRNENLILYKKYNPKDYPKYDNYDAINVDKVKDIPMDYAGAMGVPITFLDKYNPEQFEIIKFRKGDDNKDLSINKKYSYTRILIKNKQTKELFI